MARAGLTAKQQFWFDHIESCASSGMSPRAYADYHGFDVQKFYCWKNKLKTLGVLPEDVSPAGSTHNSAVRVDTCSPDQRSAAFVRAALMPTSGPPKRSEFRSCDVRISLANGITIDAPKGIAADELSALIHAAMQIQSSEDGPRS